MSPHDASPRLGRALAVGLATLLLAASGAAGQTPQAPQLVVTKTDSPDPVEVGGNLTYFVNVTNVGNATATNVNLTDTLPSSVVLEGYYSPTHPGACGVSLGDEVLCDFGDLDANETGRVVIWVTPTETGVIVNTANVTSDDAPSVEVTENTTVVPEATTLAVTKEDSPDPVVVGGNLTYFVNVTNVGDEFAFNVTLNDTLPENVTFEGAAVTYTGMFPGICVLVGDVVHCDLGTLPPGTSANVTLWVRPVAPGVAVDRAVAEADNAPPVEAVEETTVLLPPPGDLVCEARQEGNLLQWTPVPNATSYRVYRAVGGGGFMLLAATSGTSFLDENVTAGQVYRYFVTAFGPGGESAPSETCEVTAIPLFAAPLLAAVALVGSVVAYALLRRRRT